MQKKYTLQLSVLVMMMLLSAVLSAQEMRSQNEKKVVVTIRGRDAQGAKITKIVVKTGKEAENFDVEKYVKENTEGIINPIVKIGDKEDFKENRNENYNENHNNIQEKYYSYNYKHNNNDKQASYKREKQGFLGVSEIEDKTENEEGVSVKITRNSGAAKAGLKEGDVLLQLNNATINTFKDISVFMRTTKPNDKIQVKYMRDGQTKPSQLPSDNLKMLGVIKLKKKRLASVFIAQLIEKALKLGRLLKILHPSVLRKKVICNWAM